MALYSATLENAIEQLARLPGVGRKTAQRYALFLLKLPEDDVFRIAESLANLKKNIRFCERCYNISETEICSICSDSKRENGQVCVVADIKDVYAFEKSADFGGKYHVLGGLISPMENIGPNEIHIRELVQRLAEGEHITEVILAFRPSAEGEATAFYINKLLKPFEIKVSRLASGIPMGADLEYIDEATISRAFSSRQNV